MQHTCFEAAISHLASSTASIAGFASIDYRLSPHPDFPQDPTSTPPSELRVAKHPDHLRDVQAALALLARDHGVERYILVGHSAGATLSFQVLTDSAAGHAPPVAVVGVAGIYDLRGINDRHGGYEGFITAAFGGSDAWDAASPARYTGDYQAVLGGTQTFLAWSTEDQLVDRPELVEMKTRLERDGVAVDTLESLTGNHDEVWKGGRQLASVVEWVVGKL